MNPCDKWYNKAREQIFVKSEEKTGLIHLLIVFLMAMLPVVELRGAIPYGFAFGLPWWQVMVASIIGNMLPVPFIILFIRKIFMWLKDRNRFAGAIYRFEKKLEKKAEKVVRYQMFGLFLFVAIPLPGTGAWTGALIAAMLDMRVKEAFPPILLGVITAGIIVAVVTYGAASLLF